MRGLLRSRSPPLSARIFPVRLVVTMLPTNCSATMASTPIVTHRIASSVRCRSRASDRVGYLQYIPAFMCCPLSLLRDQAIHEVKCAVGGAGHPGVVGGHH